MTKNEFYEKVQVSVLDKLGDGYQTKVQKVQKNNGIYLQGLVIIEKENNISPMIYLDPFWESYQMGMPFAVIVDRIVQICKEDVPKDSIDLSFFNEFEKVKDRICYRLVSYEKNKELLEKIPHLPYLDFAICFFYSYEGSVLGNGSILIHDTHMKMWNTTTEELYLLAKDNTPRLYPAKRENMEDVLRRLSPMPDNDLAGAEELPLWVLSNEQNIYGAGCILYDELQESIAREIGKDFYVIPSSVHEVLILRDDRQDETEHWKTMIEEINRTQVEASEVLSNNLYHFDLSSKKLEIV